MSQLFKLKNGTVLLSTEAPGGVYNSGQLKKIAELCSKELAVVKATEDQRLALFVKESEVQQVAQQLRAIGLGFRNYQDGLHQPVSCLGELCEEHEQPALATAMNLTKEIAAISLQSSLKIGLNGCARCCTPCHTLDISIIGDSSGYRISLGGKGSQVPELSSFFAESVPATELPKLIKNIVLLFKEKAESGESLHDVLERCGVSDFVKALAPYSQDAAQREDPFANSNDDDASESVSENSIEETEAHEDNFADDFAESDETAGHKANQQDFAEEEAFAVDLDDPGQLEEIPIEAINQASLDDDLSLDEGDLRSRSKRPLDLENDITLDDDISDADLELTVTDEFENGSTPSDLTRMGEVRTEDEEIHDDVDFDLEAAESDFSEVHDELPLEKGGLETELALARNDRKASEDSFQPVEDARLSDDVDLESAAEDETADNEIESMDEMSALDLEDEEVDEDLLLDDGALDSKEISTPEILLDSVTEDEIPELDEELADKGPSSAQAVEPKTAAQVKDKPANNLDSEFEDELESDLQVLTDDEESDFEKKLHASIEEESQLLANSDHDHNLSDRQAALSFLEQDDAPVSNEEVDDESMEEIRADQPEEIEAPAPQSVEEPKPLPIRSVKSPAKRGNGFRLAGVSFEDKQLRIRFESGAYVDFDLGTLTRGEERAFSLGEQKIAVTQTDDGYTLEIDGMRMFYPASAWSAAS